jgi:hypothetical protein
LAQGGHSLIRPSAQSTIAEVNVENADHCGKVALGMFRYLGENRSILASEL